MKRIIIALSLMIYVSCSKETAQKSETGLSINISDYPAFCQPTKTIGVKDDGKCKWVSGDQIFIVIATQSNPMAYRYRITYNGSVWKTIEKYALGSYSAVPDMSCGSEPFRVRAYYAPSYDFDSETTLSLKKDKSAGIEEYFTWTSGDGYTLNNSSSLNISFERQYSRIRVSTTAGYSVKLASAGFVPAGYSTSSLGGYTLYTASDNSGNAFFYGTWPAGTDLEFTAYDNSGGIVADRKYENRAKSVNGYSYALYCKASSSGDDPGGTEGGKDIDDDEEDDFVVESDFSKVITVTFSTNSAIVNPQNILPVSISGADVVLGETASSVTDVKIIVSGTTTDGSLKLYNGKKMLLSLNGASITSQKGAAINNQCGKRLYVQLSGTNALADAATYTDIVEGEDSKACMFSEGQLIFSGTGSLTVSGNYKHAIASDDYVRVLGGTVTVTKAATDGIKVNDYYRQDGGTVNIASTSDGIQCDRDHIKVTGGKLVISTSGEKASGLQAAGDISITGGEVQITVNGNGSKCVKSEANITVKAGTHTFSTKGSAYYDSTDGDVASPACLRAENICSIEGGTITCTSTGKAGKGINSYIVKISGESVTNVNTSGTSFSYNGDYSYAKGIKGSNSVEINGGETTITTSGSGAEGLESKGNLVMNDGFLYIKAYDDGINAAESITFNGGYTYCYSTNNDGIDSNYGKSNAVVFNGGVVIAHSSRSPEEGIDADNDAYLTFAGGTVFCSGGKQGGGGRHGGGPGGGGPGGGGPGGGGPGGGGTSSSPSCSQPTILLSGFSISTGYFTFTDSSNKVIFACYVPRSMSQNYSFVSSPKLKSGTTYNYGILSSLPTGYSESWKSWFCFGGTASVSSGSVTATSGFLSK